MAARKIDGWWYVDFRVRKVRYRKRSPKNTRAGALEYEEFLRGQLATNTSLKHLDPAKQREKATVPNFAAFADRWLDEYVAVNYRWSEWRQRKCVLRARLTPWFGDLALDEITLKHIDDYKGDQQEEGLSKKTINNHLTILRKCLLTAVEWELIAKAPEFHLLRVIEEPPFRYLQPDETRRLLESMPAGLWHALALTAVRTGLRYSELIALQWSDINFDNRLICVQRAEVRYHSGPTKTGRVRHVPMTTEVIHALRNLPRHDNRVFSYRGRSVPYPTAWTCIATACQQAGVPHVTWHDLRHTFASDLTRRRVSLHAIKELLGHKNIEMTLRYAHLGNESLHQAIAALEPASEWRAAGGQQPPTAHRAALQVPHR